MAMTKSWVMCAVLILLLIGCTQQSVAPIQESTEPKIMIVATTGMVGDLVREIGGSRVEFLVLMGPKVNPHSYEPSEGERAKIDSADILFYNGLGLETGMEQVLNQNREKSVAVTKDIPKEELLSLKSKGDDPHLWLDPILWVKAAKTVRDELIAYDPSSKALYEKNANEYVQKMSNLDEYVRQRLSTIPEDQRIIATAHDAFGYFGKRYDFEIIGLQEESEQEIQAITDTIIKKKINVIFMDSARSNVTVLAIQKAAQKQGQNLTIEGTLHSDDMGDQGTFEGTYLGMVASDSNTIAKDLGKK